MKGKLSLKETWIPVAGRVVGLTHWVTLGSPRLLLALQFPRCPRMPQTISRVLAVQVFYEPKTHYQQVPSKAPAQSRRLNSDARTPLEAGEETRLVAC